MRSPGQVEHGHIYKHGKEDIPMSDDNTPDNVDEKEVNDNEQTDDDDTTSEETDA